MILLTRLLPRPPESPRRPNQTTPESQHQVWVQGADGPRAVPLRTGVSNGRTTEVLQGALRPGTEVITDIADTSNGH